MDGVWDDTGDAEIDDASPHNQAAVAAAAAAYGLPAPPSAEGFVSAASSSSDVPAPQPSPASSSALSFDPASPAEVHGFELGATNFAGSGYWPCVIIAPSTIPPSSAVAKDFKKLGAAVTGSKVIIRFLGAKYSHSYIKYASFDPWSDAVAAKVKAAIGRVKKHEQRDHIKGLAEAMALSSRSREEIRHMFVSLQQPSLEEIDAALGVTPPTDADVQAALAAAAPASKSASSSSSSSSSSAAAAPASGSDAGAAAGGGGNSDSGVHVAPKAKPAAAAPPAAASATAAPSSASSSSSSAPSPSDPHIRLYFCPFWHVSADTTWPVVVLDAPTVTWWEAKVPASQRAVTKAAKAAAAGQDVVVAQLYGDQRPLVVPVSSLVPFKWPLPQPPAEGAPAEGEAAPPAGVTATGNLDYALYLRFLAACRGSRVYKADAVDGDPDLGLLTALRCAGHTAIELAKLTNGNSSASSSADATVSTSASAVFEALHQVYHSLGKVLLPPLGPLPKPQQQTEEAAAAGAGAAKAAAPARSSRRSSTAVAGGGAGGGASKAGVELMQHLGMAVLPSADSAAAAEEDAAAGAGGGGGRRKSVAAAVAALSAEGGEDDGATSAAAAAKKPRKSVGATTKPRGNKPPRITPINAHLLQRLVWSLFSGTYWPAVVVHPASVEADKRRRVFDDYVSTRAPDLPEGSDVSGPDKLLIRFFDGSYKTVHSVKAPKVKQDPLLLWPEPATSSAADAAAAATEAEPEASQRKRHDELLRAASGHKSNKSLVEQTEQAVAEVAKPRAERLGAAPAGYVEPAEEAEQAEGEEAEAEEEAAPEAAKPAIKLKLKSSSAAAAASSAAPPPAPSTAAPAPPAQPGKSLDELLSRFAELSDDEGQGKGASSSSSSKHAGAGAGSKRRHADDDDDDSGSGSGDDSDASSGGAAAKAKRRRLSKGGSVPAAKPEGKRLKKGGAGASSSSKKHHRRGDDSDGSDSDGSGEHRPKAKPSSKKERAGKSKDFAPPAATGDDDDDPHRRMAYVDDEDAAAAAEAREALAAEGGADEEGGRGRRKSAARFLQAVASGEAEARAAAAGFDEEEDEAPMGGSSKAKIAAQVAEMRVKAQGSGAIALEREREAREKERREKERAKAAEREKARNLPPAPPAPVEPAEPKPEDQTAAVRIASTITSAMALGGAPALRIIVSALQEAKGLTVSPELLKATELVMLTRRLKTYTGTPAAASSSPPAAAAPVAAAAPAPAPADPPTAPSPAPLAADGSAAAADGTESAAPAINSSSSPSTAGGSGEADVEMKEGAPAPAPAASSSTESGELPSAPVHAAASADAPPLPSALTASLADNAAASSAMAVEEPAAAASPSQTESAAVDDEATKRELIATIASMSDWLFETWRKACTTLVEVRKTYLKARAAIKAWEEKTKVKWTPALASGGSSGSSSSSSSSSGAAAPAAPAPSAATATTAQLTIPRHSTAAAASSSSSAAAAPASGSSSFSSMLANLTGTSGANKAGANAPSGSGGNTPSNAAGTGAGAASPPPASDAVAAALSAPPPREGAYYRAVGVAQVMEQLTSVLRKALPDATAQLPSSSAGWIEISASNIAKAVAVGLEQQVFITLPALRDGDSAALPATARHGLTTWAMEQDDEAERGDGKGAAAAASDGSSASYASREPLSSLVKYHDRMGLVLLALENAEKARAAKAGGGGSSSSGSSSGGVKADQLAVKLVTGLYDVPALLRRNVNNREGGASAAAAAAGGKVNVDASIEAIERSQSAPVLTGIERTAVERIAQLLPGLVTNLAAAGPTALWNSAAL